MVLLDTLSPISLWIRRTDMLALVTNLAIPRSSCAEVTFGRPLLGFGSLFSLLLNTLYTPGTDLRIAKAISGTVFPKAFKIQIFFTSLLSELLPFTHGSENDLFIGFSAAEITQGQGVL